MTAEAYKPRRARLDDDEAVLDDHQRLLVAVENLAIEWTTSALTLRDRGGDLRTVAAHRAHAEQLRTLARQHTGRHR